MSLENVMPGVYMQISLVRNSLDDLSLLQFFKTSKGPILPKYQSMNINSGNCHEAERDPEIDFFFSEKEK